MNDPASIPLQRQLERISVIAAELDLSDGSPALEALDGMVCDCAAEQASEVNNGGVQAQLQYLLEHGWTHADILGRAKIAAEEGGGS